MSGSKGRWVMIAVLAQALFLLVFAIAGIYGVALPALALAGVVNAIAGALIATLIQLAAPGHLRGRVMSLYLMCVVGVPSIGSFALGSVAEWSMCSSRSGRRRSFFWSSRR